MNLVKGDLSLGKKEKARKARANDYENFKS